MTTARTSNTDSPAEWAHALVRSGRAAEACSTLEQAIAQDPDDMASRYALGVCLNRIDKPFEAERQLRAVLAKKPDDPMVAYELGRALQGLGRFAEAATAFRNALVRRNITDAWNRLRSCEAPVPDTDKPAVAYSGVLFSTAFAAHAFAAMAAEAEENSTSAGSQDAPADAGRTVLVAKTQRRGLVPWAATITLLAVGIVAGPFLLSGDARLIIGALLAVYVPLAWISVFARAHLNRFHFYTRRVDLHVGVLSRQKLVVWYRQVESVQYVRRPFSYLTHTASLDVVYREGDDTVTARLEHLGTPQEVERLYLELQTHVARERHTLSHP